MCQEGDFKKCDIPLRKKIEYEKFMTMQPGAITPEEIVIDQDNLLGGQQINTSSAQLIRPSLLPPSETSSKTKNARSEEDSFIDEEARDSQSKRSEMAIISSEM